MIQNVETNVTLSGQVKTDTRFYYRKLSKFPSKMAEIEYSINFKKIDVKISLDIYTTEDDLNLKTNCSNNVYGQLRNENLHTPMKLRSKPYRFTMCIIDDFNSDMVHCEGKVTIQDYKARNYVFSFGYRCKYVVRPSLRGLSFNFTISGQTNETTCTKVPDMEDGFFNCHHLYTCTSLPNMFGSEDEDDLNRVIESPVTSPGFGVMLSKNGRLCHNYAREFLCHVFYPNCHVFKKQLIHPCRETCYEFFEACSKNIQSFFRKLDFEGSLFSLSVLRSGYRSIADLMNCDYLPTINGTIPCFYEPVTCQPPPNVTNAKIIDGYEINRTYIAMSQVVYECLDEAFQIPGNNTVTCLYSGEWNKVPKCLKGKIMSEMNPLSIVIPLLTTPFLIFIIICIIMKHTCQRKKLLKRNREYDSFVCYNFDEDKDFLFNSILPELEEHHDPPLKMFIHDRDFIPGKEISINIHNAISNCNSAIIVMSQGFIDSPRCREEFTKCLAEKEEDPAFKLFIIMMDKVDALINVPQDMQVFFKRTTYLKHDDPKLFEKIGNHLDLMRERDVLDDNIELEHLVQNQVEL